MLTTLFGRSLTASTTDTVTLMVMFELADGSWVDITADFMSGSVRRGRSRELDRYQAGTATLVLRNEDRTYDPNYTSSPYNGSILPMRRMKVLALQNSVTYCVFTGYVESWRQIYDGPKAGYAEAHLIDANFVLAAKKMQNSVWAEEVEADSPRAWFRLGEADQATTIDRVAARVLTEFGTGGSLGVAGLVNSDTNTAYSGTGTTSGYAGTDAYITAGFTHVTLEALVKTTVTTDSTICSVSDPGTGQRFELYVFSTGIPVFKWGKTTAAGNTSAANTDGTTLVNDGRTHHIVGVFNATTGATSIYVDGVLEGGPGLQANIANGGSQEFCIGNIATGFVSPVTRTQGIVGTVDEVVLYLSVLPAARILAHANAALNPWDGDTPRARAGEILDTIDWPTSDRVLSEGDSTLQNANLEGKTVLDALQTVADSEFGQLYVDVHGGVVLEGRAESVNQTSQGTFADANNTGEDIRMAEPEYTAQLIRNEVTIQRTGGAAMTTSDATSITAYLTHSYSKTGLEHDSDLVSQNAAQYIVSKYKDPLQRISRLVLEPRKDPNNLFPHALGRELTDRVTVKYTPQGVGTVFSQDAIIEGIEHEFGPKMWRTTWALSPADTLAYWQLGTAGFGELGTTTRLFF